MRTFFEAATTYPVFPFTVALTVVVCFWLLVAVGAAHSGSFDDDADAEVWGLGGVPVSVGFSLVTGAGWLASLCATVLLDSLVLSGPVRALTGIAVLIAAPLLAWRVARVLVRPLHRLFPEEPGPPSVPGEARTGDVIGRRDADSEDPRWGTSRDTALHLRDRAA